jgi:RNA polymerase sigma-70 factor, ECF subfamily
MESFRLVKETELVTRAVRGDPAAFGNLIERYGGDVYRVAVTLTRNRDEAEDLMQETFVAAFEGISRFAGRSAFKTWLLSILFRQAGRLRRYQRLRPSASSGEPEANERDARAVTGEAARHASSMDMQTMLNSLSVEHRAVLVLRELQGM